MCTACAPYACARARARACAPPTHRPRTTHAPPTLRPRTAHAPPRREQLSFLHLYHHSSIVVVWGWVVHTPARLSSRSGPWLFAPGFSPLAFRPWLFAPGFSPLAFRPWLSASASASQSAAVPAAVSARASPTHRASTSASTSTFTSTSICAHPPAHSPAGGPLTRRPSTLMARGSTPACTWSCTFTTGSPPSDIDLPPPSSGASPSSSRPACTKCTPCSWQW
jgi:hypothetical protein